jgi:hypothetical protein
MDEIENLHADARVLDAPGAQTERSGLCLKEEEIVFSAVTFKCDLGLSGGITKMQTGGERMENENATKASHRAETDASSPCSLPVLDEPCSTLASRGWDSNGAFEYPRKKEWWTS